MINHKIILTKILCELIRLLGSTGYGEELTRMGIDKKEKSDLINMLIVLQYDELTDTEAILTNRGSMPGCIVLPHVYEEFKDPTKRVSLEEAKRNNIDLRKLIPREFTVDKVRTQVIK
jgi:hypothetical protein